jgi:hypothetical protein
MMKSLKQDILSTLAICSLAIVIALAWGSPFIDASPAYAEDHAPLKQLLHTIPLKAKPHPGAVKQPSNR